MSEFFERLESRELLSATSYSPSGTFAGTATPANHTSALAIIAATGTKKGGGTVAATLDLTIATNSIVTGSLVLTGVGTYAISGMVVEVDVSVSLDLNGMGVGTFAGKLKALNKKLVGPFTDTVDGKTVDGKLNLINSASQNKKSSKSGQNVALAPGYVPNETPPPITSGVGAGSSVGDQTGVTGGNNSGPGTIDNGGGSILG